MKIGVIGAGLGGLLAAASLGKAGHDIEIFERLPYHGGRFTNIDYKGFRLSTGALHVVPHGPGGPLGTMLKRLGANVSIVPTNPPGLFRIKGKDYTHNELPGLFGTWNKVKLLKVMADLKYSNGGDESYLEWVSKRVSHHMAFGLADSFCRWSLSLDADEVSSREIVAITRNVHRYGGPGIPIGGCKSVSDSLESLITAAGGTIKYSTPVEEIHVEDGRVRGISTKAGEHTFDVVISDIGPKATIELCKNTDFPKEYTEFVSSSKSANGIKMSFALDSPLIGQTCCIFTPEAERVGGLVELTHTDPGFAPKGRHLLMSHQKLIGNNVEKEIEQGIEDIKDAFPGFEKHSKLLMVQSYKNHWPVNRTTSGMHIPPETPVHGLYNVGDGIKPLGLMETEGVAGGVELMLERFNKDFQGV